MINEHSRVLEQHQRAIAKMMSMITVLRKAVTSVNQVVETHFIHESMEDIFANKPNLRFIHHQDLPRVLKIIAKQANINVKQMNEALPIVELIHQLLIQQRIEFIQIDTKEQAGQCMIGNLLFTLFFAAANKNQHPFSTYTLIPIPFNQATKDVN